MADFFKITTCFFVTLFIQQGACLMLYPRQQPPPQQPPPAFPQQPPANPPYPANIIPVGSPIKQFPINLSNNIPAAPVLAAAPAAAPAPATAAQPALPAFLARFFYPRVAPPPAAFDLTNQIQGTRRSPVYQPPRFMAPRRRQRSQGFFDMYAPYFFMENFDII